MMMSCFVDTNSQKCKTYTHKKFSLIQLKGFFDINLIYELNFYCITWCAYLHAFTSVCVHVCGGGGGYVCVCWWIPSCPGCLSTVSHQTVSTTVHTMPSYLLAVF